MTAFHTDRLSYPCPGAGASRRQLLAASGMWATLALLAAGCASKPVVTPVKLNLVGGADMNPDARGRASPLVIRVYALKSPGAFQSADFFTLFEKDVATLGADLVKREEALLSPGVRQQLEWTLPPEATALGLLGAYRDLSRAQWRQLVPLQPGQPLQLTASFGARGMALEHR